MKIYNKRGGISIVRDTVINQTPPIVITNEQKVEESTEKVEEPTNVHDIEEENIDLGVSLPKKSKKTKQNEG